SPCRGPGAGTDAARGGRALLLPADAPQRGVGAPQHPGGNDRDAPHACARAAACVAHRSSCRRQAAMSTSCLDLVAFAEGELAPERAASFRAHLAACPACQLALLEAMPLGAHLEALGMAIENGKHAPPPVAAPTLRVLSHDHEPPGGSDARPAAPEDMPD